MPLSSAEDNSLREWNNHLVKALQLLDLDLDVDVERIVELARKSAESVSPHAGAVSAFIVGYAAGTASTNSRKEVEDAIEAAIDTARRVIDRVKPGGPECPGWHKTAQ
ncbi:hypothetical protein E3O44_06225 [Cryobacterium algoricola]|uniref:DUF6457 domain-containing protein n=2 Tax=Cryobacterium algoricola TaxID=1259183 RepID=A0ABY2IEM9_9MICO|nr:hypothetical protein E3O44_06225 [Cryobacterium algoricola]